MSSRLQAVSPGTQSLSGGDPTRRTSVRTTRLRSVVHIGWLGQVGKVVVATTIQAIVILGFVVLTLGLGGEGHVGIGPDRPPLSASPAGTPAPPPEQT
jgi:hypothetical protein